MVPWERAPCSDPSPATYLHVTLARYLMPSGLAFLLMQLAVIASALQDGARMGERMPPRDLAQVLARAGL